MQLNIDILFDFISLFYPELCVVCEGKLLRQEKYICLKCLYELPMTNFHEIPENMVEQIFWGRVKIERATALFFFRKGSKYQRLIYHMKYKGIKEIGEYLGSLLGHKLKENRDFKDVDFIVPVPLHQKKERERGYNQSEWIAKGIARVMGKEVKTGNLIRIKEKNTQTKKDRFERWQNMEGIFELNDPKVFSGKHILLVDDVITTGSTLEASAQALLKSEKIRISIAALGYVDL